MIINDDCIGKRIKLLKMGEDPDPIPPFTEGVITWVCPYYQGTETYYQLSVDWDNGRTLGLVTPHDKFVFI